MPKQQLSQDDMRRLLSDIVQRIIGDHPLKTFSVYTDAKDPSSWVIHLSHVYPREAHLFNREQMLELDYFIKGLRLRVDWYSSRDYQHILLVPLSAGEEVAGDRKSRTPDPKLDMNTMGQGKHPGKKKGTKSGHRHPRTRRFKRGELPPEDED